MARSLRLLGGRLSQRTAALAAVLVLAFTVGYWNQSHVHVAQLLALLPLVTALFCRPQVAVVLGVAALPLLVDVTSTGVRLTVSDGLLVLALAAALPPLILVSGWRERMREAAPILIAALPFSAWLVAVAINHSSLLNWLKTGQYYQLFLLPLLLGAVVIEKRAARVALIGYVAASTLIAVLWATTGGNFSFAANKNPAGQMIANAIILVLALAPSWPWRLVTLVPLVIGLGFTQSRGSIVAAGVGIIVLLALRGLGTWRRTIAAIIPLAVVVAIGYQTLPADVQARATDYSSGNASTSLASLSAAEYSVRLREIYRENGWELIAAHPVFGVGPGNYRTGTPGSPEENTDPHNLVIRTAGDTGYPGLLGFGLLVAASTLLAVRRRNVNPYAAVAVALQAALIIHGFVDVYWVRGTPVLGWLLVGMAMNRRLDEVRVRPDRDRRGLPQRRTPRSLPVLTPPQPAGLGDRQLR